MEEKIGNKEAVCFIVIAVLNGLVLNTNKIIIKNCGSSSLINSIFVCIIALIIVFLMCKLVKKFPSSDILDISKYLGGKFLQFIVGILYIGYFGFITAILLRKMSDCLQIIFYPMTDLIFIVLLFTIAAGIASRLGKAGVFKSSLIIFPVIAVILILVFLGNAKNFDLYNIYPILGNGIDSTFISGATNLVAFMGSSYLYFLPTYLSNPEKFKKISVISMIIASLFFILITATVLFMYSTTLSNSELFPLYIAVRYIEFGTFIQRMDSTFLLISTLAFISYLSINTTICTNILKKIANLSDNKPIIYPYLLCIFSVAVLIRNNPNLEFLENFVFKILFFAIPICISFSILVLANIKKLLQFTVKTVE